MRGFPFFFVLGVCNLDITQQDVLQRVTRATVTTVLLPTLGIWFDDAGVLALQTFTGPSDATTRGGRALADARLPRPPAPASPGHRESVWRATLFIRRLKTRGCCPRALWLMGREPWEISFCLCEQRDAT